MERPVILPRVIVLTAALTLTLSPALVGNASSTPTKDVAAVLQPFVDSHALAGAVTLVANKDKVLALDVVGFADIGAKKPMTADAIFWIASRRSISGSGLGSASSKR